MPEMQDATWSGARPMNPPCSSVQASIAFRRVTSVLVAAGQLPDSVGPLAAVLRDEGHQLPVLGRALEVEEPAHGLDRVPVRRVGGDVGNALPIDINGTAVAQGCGVLRSIFDHRSSFLVWFERFSSASAAAIAARFPFRFSSYYICP